MSFRRHEMWSVVCDYPGCDASAQDGGDHVAWAQQFAALDEARDAGWLITGKTHYCTAHITWSADESEVVPLPQSTP